MPFKIPMVLEKDNIIAVREYNQMHAQEHQDIAGWLNALASAHGVPITVTYYSLPVFDPTDEKSISLFFDVNWKQHMVFYDAFNQIGQKVNPPVFIFPKNYPSNIYDLTVESFVKLEYEIHMMLWKTIDVLRG